MFRDDARFVLSSLPALTARVKQVTQIRQTILNLAVRGKLVAQDPGEEPGAALLRRIDEAHKTRLKSAAPAAPPYEAPAGWTWATLGNLVLHSMRVGAQRPRATRALTKGGAFSK